MLSAKLDYADDGGVRRTNFDTPDGLTRIVDVEGLRRHASRLHRARRRIRILKVDNKGWQNRLRIGLTSG